MQIKETSERLPKSIDIRSFSRPPAVAFLVPISEAESSHQILDGIFHDSYSRWGGSHSLLVPVNDEGRIEDSYKLWLKALDPDFIYTYVDIGVDLIRELNHLVMPIAMIKGKELGGSGSWRKFIPNWGHYLRPIQSLSTLMSPHALGRKSNAKLPGGVYLTQRHENDTHRFFPDNFGVAHDSHTATYGVEGLFETLSFCPKDYPDNHYAGNSKSSDLNAIFNKLSAGEIRSFNKLSAIHSEGINHPREYSWQNSFHLYLGDSILDRINFWNSRHLSANFSGFANVSLRIPKEQSRDELFVKELGNFLNKNNFASQSNGPAQVKIHSLELGEKECSDFSLKLKKHTWNQVVVKCGESGCAIPGPDDLRRAHIHAGSKNPSFKVQDSSHSYFAGEPSHFQYLPQSLFGTKNGQWIVEFEIERHKDDCEISNIFSDWNLPRKDEVIHAFTDNLGKVSRLHNLTVLTKISNSDMFHTSNNAVDNVVLRFPDDETVFRYLVLGMGGYSRYEEIRACLDQSNKYQDLNISDKGQQHRGVVALFDGSVKAASVLTNKYWRKIVRESLEDSDEKLEELKKLTEKYSDSELTELVGSIKIRARNKPQLYSLDKFCGYINDYSDDDLKSLIEAYRFKDSKEAKKYLRENLKDSVEEFVHSGVIQNLHCWTCDYCGNKNSLNLDALKVKNECSVCNFEYFTKVDFDWKFQMSKFVTDALAQKNGMTVLWGISTLIDRSRARQAMYIPEVNLVKDIEDPNSTNEIDLIALIDGSFVLAEVKFSAIAFYNSNREVEKFVDVVTRIHPDKAYLIFEQYCQDEEKESEFLGVINQAFIELNERMPFKTMLEMIIAKTDPEYNEIPMEIGPSGIRTHRVLY